MLCLVISSYFLYIPIVSFQIYDFDGDGFISVGDLTSIIAATLREHRVLIKRQDIDQIVALTFQKITCKHANLVTFDE